MSSRFLESQLDILIGWMFEREAIRKRKLQGLPWPWTSDPLLRDFRWCNVRRLDDRVSQELFEVWYRPEADDRTLFASVLLGRLINWPQALVESTRGQPFQISDLPLVCSNLNERADRGDKVFTGAYIVPGVPGFKKVDSVCLLVEKILAHHSPVLASSMRDTWTNLLQFAGMGRFLAGQVVADLAHLSPGRYWRDADTWAPLGPGSARGLNRLMGKPKESPLSQSDFDIYLPDLIGVLQPRTKEICEDRRLQAMDWQSVLCETDKLNRLRLQEGQVRAKYDGAGSAQQALL